MCTRSIGGIYNNKKKYYLILLNITETTTGSPRVTIVHFYCFEVKNLVKYIIRENKHNVIAYFMKKVTKN